MGEGIVREVCRQGRMKRSGSSSAGAGVSCALSSTPARLAALGACPGGERCPPAREAVREADGKRPHRRFKLLLISTYLLVMPLTPAAPPGILTVGRNNGAQSAGD